MAEALAFLRLVGLGKRFGGLTALADVDLEVPRQEICGVIGPNGAGKSTLFNIVAGAYPPSTGEAVLDGTRISGLPSHKVATMGVARAFQLVNLFGTMSVAENVMVGAERHDRLKLWQAITHLSGFAAERRQAAERAARAIELVGIGHLAPLPVSQITYGQQRLVATARALAAEPRLLLLDEPAAGLAGPEIEALSAAIGRARDAGATVLLVEHNVDFVMRLCDHVAVLHFGRKIADGPPAAVRSSEAVIEAYIGR
ncbi:MAG: ABC transporter ATP-binding protein [Alphaproteobacteria bacterium]|nr:ABC transporter ATP-binding protein [Alphaproteobacteria bacterium]